MEKDLVHRNFSITIRVNILIWWAEEFRVGGRVQGGRKSSGWAEESIS
jgi:hypothetical protein